MANGRRWTQTDIANLYTYAETVSQQEAADRLGRTWQAVAQKAKDMGIRWRRGSWNYTSIAREVGCSATSVRRLVRILLAPIPGYGADGSPGRRVMLTDKQAERVIRVLRGARRFRGVQIRAGKIRWSRADSC